MSEKGGAEALDAPVVMPGTRASALYVAGPRHGDPGKGRRRTGEELAEPVGAAGERQLRRLQPVEEPPIVSGDLAVAERFLGSA